MQVGIVGAGPAGLLLAHLLDRQGISCSVLEARSRDYIEHRVRAGVLEQGTVDLLTQAGVGERLAREGLAHHGLELRFDGCRRRIPLSELAGGRCITVYGQQELVKDLVAARIEAGCPPLFEVEEVSLRDLEGDRPAIRFRHQGEERELHCDLIAGCDGFHGISRPSIPTGVLRSYERAYPFAWLGILAEAAPATEELIYARHDHGFALHSMRSPELSRCYLQCAPDEDIHAWSDDQIWAELQVRLGADADWSLNEGPIIDRSVAGLRGFVVEPMQYGRLFLAGDAAHIVPATGAKGLNLAVADVRVLAEAVAAWYRTGDEALLAAYSGTCLQRVWRAEHFSWWMTSMLHRWPDRDSFDERLQRAQLAYIFSSKAAATTLAENYVGLPA